MRMTKERAIEILTIDAERASIFEVAEAVDLAVDALKGYEWIPCSDRLPGKMGMYLATVDYKKHGRAVISIWFHNSEIGWDARFKNDVLAWMPLPEPYKRGETE